MLIAIHGSLLRGRQEVIVQSVLAAPPARFARDPAVDLATLAAAYAAAIAQTYGFVAGSRRTAFLAAYIFLGLNGYGVAATELEVASVIRRVADRQLGDAELAERLRRGMVRER